MKIRIACCTLVCAAMLVASLSACLGPAPTVVETKPDSSTYTARIDGDAWIGSFSGIDAYGTGGYFIHGFQLQVLNPAAVTIYLYDVTGTGEFPLGSSDFGRPRGSSIITYTLSGSLWSTPSTGSAGTITITMLTSTRMAGTFSFTATPDAGFGPNRVVTEGKFDLPIKASASVTSADSTLLPLHSSAKQP